MSVLILFIRGGSVLNIVLGLLLLGVSLYDLKTRRVPNVVTFPLFFAVLTYQGFQGHLSSALLGAGTGFLWLLIPYLRGWVGAGDVKLLTGIGAWVAWPDAWPLALFSGALGAPLVLLAALRREDLKPLWFSIAGGPGSFLKEIASLVRARKNCHVPYAFSIFLGFTVICLLERIPG